MKLLLELTLRGTLMFVVVVILDRLFSERISARARRAWWLLVPVAFLLTIPLPTLPAPTAPAVRAWDRFTPTQQVEHWAGASAIHLQTAVPPVAARFSLPIFIWATGVSGYLLVAGVRTRLAVRRWNRERFCTDATLLEALEDCKREVGITAPIGLVVSEKVATPVVLGWLRPRILLPAGLVNALSAEKLRGVLFHELAHFRTLDVPINWLFTLVCALHWFNPAAHLAFRSYARFCEEAADEAAITFLQQPSSMSYGETLLQVLKQTSGQPAPYAALAIVESFGQLKKRLNMIKQYHQKSTHALLTTAVFLLVVLCLLLRPVQAAETTWGTVTDPDQDCRFTFAGGKLTIAIPGKDHALAAEVGRTNAPRVLQEVNGDFVAQVKVSGDYPANVTSAVQDFRAFQGAGLLLWQDAGNYVRLERAQLTDGSNGFGYAIFESRTDGKVDQYTSTAVHPLQGKYAYLRLERHGQQLAAAVSQDGEKWEDLDPITLPWMKNVRVGVDANQNTTTPFTAEFEDFKVGPATGEPLSKRAAAAASEKPSLTSNEVAVKVGPITVATIPAGQQLDITAAKSTGYNGKTRTATFEGDVKLVVNVNGKPAVTFSSDSLAVTLQK